MSNIKTLSLPKDEPYRSQTIQKILEHYTLLSMSEDGSACSVIEKTIKEDNSSKQMNLFD